jgi:hypothetical protein
MCREGWTYRGQGKDKAGNKWTGKGDDSQQRRKQKETIEIKIRKRTHSVYPSNQATRGKAGGKLREENLQI